MKVSLYRAPTGDAISLYDYPTGKCLAGNISELDAVS